MAKGIYERKGQHGDVTYYIRFQSQGKDIKERVGRKLLGCTRELAKQALKSRLGDLARGHFNLERTRQSIPFSKLAKRFREYAQNQWRSYEQEEHMIRVFERLFGDTPLSQITPWQIEKWKSERRKEVAAITVNRLLTVIKSMFTKAVEWDLTRSNPAAKVRAFVTISQRTRYLREDETPLLLAACKEGRPWLLPIVVLALNTGLRLGELLTLQWDNINLDQDLLTIQQPKTLRTKTIPLNRPAREALLGLQDTKRGEYVFLHLWGKRIDSFTVWRNFKIACLKASISGLRFHDLRHSFGSALAMAGVDLVTIKELMGHTNIEMTMRYAHLSPQHKARAVERLSARYSSQTPAKEPVSGTYLEQNRNIANAGRRQLTEVVSGLGTKQPLEVGGHNNLILEGGVEQ